MTKLIAMIAIVAVGTIAMATEHTTKAAHVAPAKKHMKKKAGKAAPKATEQKTEEAPTTMEEHK